jgi:hypothetical protein
MLMNIAIAAALMVATTGIHAGGMVLAMHALRAQGHSSRRRLKQTRIYWVGGIILLMFIVSLVEVLVWAVTYLALNAIDGFSPPPRRATGSSCSAGRPLSSLPLFNASTLAKKPSAIAADPGNNRKLAVSTAVDFFDLK